MGEVRGMTEARGKARGGERIREKNMGIWERGVWGSLNSCSYSVFREEPGGILSGVPRRVGG